MRTLLWFRGKDLRLTDHQALSAALSSTELIPLFVLDPYFFDPIRASEIPHRMQFLLESIQSLQTALKSYNSKLLLVSGKSTEVVPQMARTLKVDQVLALRWSEPFGRERDRRVQEQLSPIPFRLFEGETLCPPATLRSGSGNPFAVFTPFAKSFRSKVVVAQPEPLVKALPKFPAKIPPDVAALEVSLPTLASLKIAHNPQLQTGGEPQAQQRLQSFLQSVAAQYHTTRDSMGVAGTSRLSADLKFGTLSVRTLWHSAIKQLGESKDQEKIISLQTYTNELLWREFALHSLWDRPTLLKEPFRADFQDFPWRDDPDGWRNWCEGETGYPVVDAAAKQLLNEGFVHNRARMITASFLCKHLMVDYRLGEKHFHKWLVDGDWALNNMGWQWSAGCGCDAQPYFRVFNPVSQGQKFDPDGAYVRRWIPALSRLPNKWIHEPWAAPKDVLKAAGVTLGTTYPKPIVKHETARERFLTAARKHLKKT